MCHPRLEGYTCVVEGRCYMSLGRMNLLELQLAQNALVRDAVWPTAYKNNPRACDDKRDASTHPLHTVMQPSMQRLIAASKRTCTQPRRWRINMMKGKVQSPARPSPDVASDPAPAPSVGDCEGGAATFCRGS